MRSSYKGLFLSRELWIKLKRKREFTGLDMFGRSTVLILGLVGKKIFHYSGRRVMAVKILEGHVGFKLGELFFTRRSARHTSKLDILSRGLFKRKKNLKS